ncbi:MAG: hypothetical protein OEM94_04095 [Acidimicrobiia bacterium]|nr:hypothetical protein [Acidimicrobiia bacterium]
MVLFGQTDIFDLDTLLVQAIVAVGAALVVGNGWAIIMDRRGSKPKGATGKFRVGRAWWLLSVGILITLWGVASLVAR